MLNSAGAGPVTGEALYADMASGQEPAASSARMFLELRHAYNRVAAFDPQSGMPQPRALTDVLKDVAALAGLGERKPPQDRTWRILEHSQQALKQILEHQRANVERQRKLMHVRAAREFDAGSIAWLSRKPGRNVREKLAGKPYLMAVERRMSNDTSENRLVKEFARLFVELLSARLECFGRNADPQADEMVSRLLRWLRSDDANEIGLWENMPPNNVLLEDRNYRKAWDAWTWLQSLDTDLERDRTRTLVDWLNLLHWVIAARLNACGAVRFSEQPCFFDVDGFSVTPLLGPLAGLFVSDRAKATVRQLHADRGYGFATAVDGRWCFFHASNFVRLAEFDRLTIGSVLLCDISEGEKGFVCEHVKLACSGPCRLELLEELRELRLTFSDGTVQISVHHAAKAAGKASVTIDKSGAFNAPMTIGGAIDVCNRIMQRRSLDDIPAQEETALADTPGETVAYAVISLGSLYPRVATPGNASRLPFRLLLQGWETKDHGIQDIDLGKVNAIALRPEEKTVSIQDVLSGDGSVPLALLDRAAMHFGHQLRKSVSASKVIYLLPDGVNEFVLERARRSMNFYFENAAPLPRSIAALFSWQASAEFEQARVRAGDCVVVIDYAAGRASMTPLVGGRLLSREKRVAGTHAPAVVWERHPCIELEEHDCFCPTTAAIRALQRQNCAFPYAIARVTGLRGLLDDDDRVSWVNEDGKWFTPQPTNAKNVQLGTKKIPADAENALSVAFVQVCELLKGKKAVIYVLELDEMDMGVGIRWHLPSTVQGRPLVPVRHKARLAEGGILLEKLQARAEGFPLWKDHLPELSMQVPVAGRFDHFDLVKDVTIVPERGTSVPIRIDRTFELPAGREFYRFPLVQGGEGRELHYVAELRSPHFTLKKDMKVRLVMTYTYGSDNPYTLTFIPVDVDDAPPGFGSVCARWQRSSATKDAANDSPAFPPRRTWSELKLFPKREGGTSDLLEWIINKLALVELAGGGSITNDALSSLRQEGVMKTDWKKNPQGNYFCFVQSDEGELYCNAMQFCEPVDPGSLGKGSHLYFTSKEGDDGRAWANNLSHTEPVPPALAASCLHAVRFPVLTAWNHGHTLGEADVPAELRHSVVGAIDYCLKLMAQADEAGDDPLAEQLRETADEAFYFLCCLHRDAPKEIYRRIEKMGREDFAHYWRSIAYAIGDAGLPHQRELFERVAVRATDGNNVCLQILGVALWRARGLLHAIPADRVEAICEALLRVLETEHHRVVRQNAETGEAYISEYVVSELELLLGLLRTRESGDEDTRRILATGSRMARAFAQIVDETTRKVCDAGVPLNTRIILELDKPEDLQRTPDLLYALHVYLLGDTGAGAIRISGIDEGD